jgi:hypothetical protein
MKNQAGIDPELICIKAKMPYCYVDKQAKTVTVRDIRPVAAYLGHSLPTGAYGFEAHGWQWVQKEVKA